MRSNLSVVIPSRGRPEQAARLVAQIQETTTNTFSTVVVDEDDPLLPEYNEALIPLIRRDVADLLAAPVPGSHVSAINYGVKIMLEWHRPTAIAKLDDDHWPLTLDWDEILLAALAEKCNGFGIVYGNDLLQGPNMPTAPLISTSIIEALGFMGPPVLSHLYVDNFWLDLGMDTGCLYYEPRVVIEHRHMNNGKAPRDAGYDRVNSSERYRIDGDAYAQWHTDPAGHAAAVQRVKESRLSV